MLAHLPRHCMASDRATSYALIYQIFIDQAEEFDAEIERAHQIRLTKNIYSMAPRVLIWLGPGRNITKASLIGDIFGGNAPLMKPPPPKS